jgi:hypothetical protein
MKIVEQVSHVPTTLQNMKVCDLVDEDGNWKWNILQGWLPSEIIINRIAAILPLVSANGRDMKVLSGAGTDIYYIYSELQYLFS